MKKIFFLVATILVSITISAQTAPNFSVNDCNGTNYDLYNQLDSGKVIVICWVMPCSSCIGPSKTSYNIVQSYQATHPGKVFLYLCDDYANTPCASVNSWANSNSIPASAFSLRFSNSVINMSGYGSAGMPKVVIVGGKDHKVLYNANNSVNSAAMQAAINEGLNANSIDETDLLNSSINVFPNPVSDILNLSFTLQNSSKVSIEIFDNIGQKVYENLSEFTSGVNKTEIKTSALANGNYFLKVSNSDRSKTSQFTVSH